MKLKFDHMIHYVDQLKGFKYPGELLKIHSRQASSIWHFQSFNLYK